jgi:hypothetical protein
MLVVDSSISGFRMLISLMPLHGIIQSVRFLFLFMISSV